LNETGAGRAIEASVSMEERVGWLWAIFFCFLVPEFLTWTRSLRICIFRTWKAPSLAHFSIITLFETLHIFGIALFVYTVLPNLKVVEGIMLTNCFCLVPGVLNMLSRNQSTSQRYLKLTLDTLAILAQLSGLILWAALDWTTSNWNVVWILPFALLFGSFGWWENYVERTSPIGIFKVTRNPLIHKVLIIYSCYYRNRQIPSKDQRRFKIHSILFLRFPQRLEIASFPSVIARH